MVSQPGQGPIPSPVASFCGGSNLWWGLGAAHQRFEPPPTEAHVTRYFSWH